MRNIPNSDKEKMFQALSGNWIIYLLVELSSPGNTTLRFAAGPDTVVHQGNTYLPLKIDVGFPTQSKDELGEGQLTLDDTDLGITYWNNANNRSKRSTVKIFCVTTQDLDTKIIGPYSYRIAEVIPQDTAAIITVLYEDRLREPTVWCRFDDHYPALHQVVQS